MREHRLYLYALDPTHIGAGGYRLGRVDNTVLRDAATGLPKLPGTSISGATRSAAIYVLPSDERRAAMEYARKVLDPEDQPTGGEADPVAKHFGYAEGGKDGTSRIGMLSFRDAHILAFPLPTVGGPRWITTAGILAEAGCATVGPADIATVMVQKRPDNSSQQQRVNLGAYLFDAEPADIQFPSELWEDPAMPGLDFVRQNLVLVHPDLFPSLVNANLETRTSVVIDFATGAAANRLLFTYEATPRGTLFCGTLGLDDDRFPDLADSAMALLDKALTLASRWGFGGMTTRGCGRMQPLLVSLEKQTC